MHHSITPPLHYSSLWYVGARRLSATKQVGLFHQPVERMVIYGPARKSRKRSGEKSRIEC
jgi:hypothetical protein